VPAWTWLLEVPSRLFNAPSMAPAALLCLVYPCHATYTGTTLPLPPFNVRPVMRDSMARSPAVPKKTRLHVQLSSETFSADSAA
jgi:hypothetical protein